jgi:2-C-methyl-D-erythritol 4-phosphate cytidylyltransferase
MVCIAASNLLASGIVEELIVTVPVGYMDQFTAALDDFGQPINFVTGGETRQQSIWNALQQLNPSCTKVLVHDAARPFAPPSLVAAVASAVTNGVKAVIPAQPVTDTIKSISRAAPASDSLGQTRAEWAVANSGYPNEGFEFVTNTLDRTELRAVQTPQGFDRATLVTAYRHAIEHQITGTDDASLVEALGTPVIVIPGDAAAMKITTPTDLKIAGVLFNPPAAQTPVNPNHPD